MAVDYTTVENHKRKAKQLGLTLEEYLLMLMIDKLDEVKQAVNWTR